MWSLQWPGCCKGLKLEPNGMSLAVCSGTLVTSFLLWLLRIYFTVYFLIIFCKSDASVAKKNTILSTKKFLPGERVQYAENTGIIVKQT